MHVSNKKWLITPPPPPPHPSLLYFPTPYSIITLKNLPEAEGGDSLQTQKEEREEGRCTTSTTHQVEMKTAVILRRVTQGPVDWEIHHVFVYLCNDYLCCVCACLRRFTATLQKPLNYSNQCESRYNKNSASFWCKFHQCNFCQTEIVMSSSVKIAGDMHLCMLTRWFAVYDFSGFLECGAEGHRRHAHTLV